MINKITLLGHAGRDAELKTGKNGSFTVFSIATGTSEKTQWHNIVVIGDQAENAYKYVKKGSLVYLEGAISYTKKDDGKTYTNIFSNFFRTLNKGAADGQEAQPTQAEKTDSERNDGGDEEEHIPF